MLRPWSDHLQLQALFLWWDGKNLMNLPVIIKVKGRFAYINVVADCPSLTFNDSTETEPYCTREKIEGPVDHSKADHDTTACKAKGSFPSLLLNIKYRACQMEKVHAQIMA
ncbi:aconitate hydratase [Massospora cicadina]|nr:aconitate hydratase [Massospora cicadina]